MQVVEWRESGQHCGSICRRAAGPGRPSGPVCHSLQACLRPPHLCPPPVKQPPAGSCAGQQCKQQAACHAGSSAAADGRLLGGPRCAGHPLGPVHPAEPARHSLGPAGFCAAGFCHPRLPAGLPSSLPALPCRVPCHCYAECLPGCHIDNTDNPL